MKKIGAIILALLFTMSLISATTFASDLSRYESALEFILMLKLVDSPQTVQTPVTRAAFTDMTVRALNMTPTGYNEFFTDVSASHEYAAAISMAANLKIISGTQEGIFNPNEIITYSAAVKMAVSALGYDKIAQAYGGYPTGYAVIANNIDLTRGLSGTWDDELDFSNAVILIYNMLNADMCKTMAVKDDNVTQVRDRDTSLLTQNFGLTKIEGIIKTAGYATMIPDNECLDAEFSIDGESFHTDIPNAQKYLGYDAVGWYDDAGVMNLIDLKSHNSVVTVNAADVESYANLDLETYNEETQREYSYSMNKAMTFVKNGRNLIPTDSDFVFKAGELKLIDNNGDGRYDVVLAKHAEYMVISSVNTSEEIVYDNRNGGKSFKKQNKDGYYTLITNENGVQMSISELAADMVLMLYKSNDEKYIEAVAFGGTIKGMITEMNSDEITIDETSFDFNEYFSERNSVTIGSNVKLLLAADKTITALASEQSDTMSYGYLVDFYKKNTIGGTVKMLLLTDSGVRITAELADKVMLDGERIDKTDARVENAFFGGDIPKYQVIRYALDENGKITKIDTAENTTTGITLEEKYSGVVYNDNSLTRYISNTKSYWHESNKLFSPHALVGSKTILIGVPSEIMGGASERVEQKYFNVISSSSLNSYGTYTIDAYDMNKYMQPGIIVVYDPNAGDNVTAKEKAAQALVENVTKGIDSDGEMIHYITFWQSGEFYKYQIKDVVYDRLKANNSVPKSGDVIRISTDIYNDINGITVDAKYDDKEKTAIITSAAPSDGQIDDSCYRGIVFVHNEGQLSLLVKQAAGFNANYSDPIKDNIAPFIMSSTIKIAVYDTKTGKIKQGRKNMLVDALSVGKEGASKIVLKCYSHSIQQMFIYE